MAYKKVFHNGNFWLQIALLQLFFLANGGHSTGVRHFYNVSSEEGRRLYNLIWDADSSSVNKLNNAMYPGIDLNMIISYCNTEQNEKIPGNFKKYKRCFTPLGIAIYQYGRQTDNNQKSLLLNKMKILIENGASVKNDPTILFLAIIRDRLDIAELIINKGVNINALRSRTLGRLGEQQSEAVIQSVAPIEQKTCDEGAFQTEDILDTTGFIYPVHAVAGIGSRKMFELFLSNGAEWSLKDNFGRNALDWAVAREDPDHYVIDKIRGKPDGNVKNEQLFGTATKERGKSYGGIIAVVAILLIALLWFFFKPEKRLKSKSKFIIDQRSTVPPPSEPSSSKPVSLSEQCMVFSSLKPVVESGFSIRNRSHFTLLVSFLPWLFFGAWMILGYLVSEDYLDKFSASIPNLVLAVLFYFSLLWAFLVSIRFIFDGYRKAAGDFTRSGYVGVLITAALIITFVILSGGMNINRSDADKIFKSAGMAIASGRLTEGVSLLEKFESTIKKPQEFLMVGSLYANAAEITRKQSWRNLPNSANPDELNAKAELMIEKAIEKAKGDVKEEACLVLSGLHQFTGNLPGQIHGLELAATYSKSAIKRSFYYYYIGNQIMMYVRTSDLREEDYKRKRDAYNYFTKSLQEYPDNYLTLIYLSNNSDSESDKHSYHERAKAALRKYQTASKKAKIEQINSMLGRYNRYQ